MSTSQKTENPWYVYLLTCKDNSYYIGITNNLEKRLLAHNGILANGAKYTKARRPVTLTAHIPLATKSEALQLEYYVRKLPRLKKLTFFKENGILI